MDSKRRAVREGSDHDWLAMDGKGSDIVGVVVGFALVLSTVMVGSDHRHVADNAIKVVRVDMAAAAAHRMPHA